MVKYKNAYDWLIGASCSTVTVTPGEYNRYEIIGEGPEFENFLNWLKKQNLYYDPPMEAPKENEGISW